MIPDLLLALMGVPGDVFTLHTDENGDESLVVAKDVDFIKIHERARVVDSTEATTTIERRREQKENGD